MDKATLAEELRKLADHLERVNATVRTHGGHGWTYDEEIPMLRASADVLDSANMLLDQSAHDKKTQ